MTDESGDVDDIEDDTIVFEECECDDPVPDPIVYNLPDGDRVKIVGCVDCGHAVEWSIAGRPVLDELRAVVREKEQRVKELEEQLSEREKEIAGLKSELERRDEQTEEVGRLKAELQQTEREFDEYQQTVEQEIEKTLDQFESFLDEEFQKRLERIERDLEEASRGEQAGPPVLLRMPVITKGKIAQFLAAGVLSVLIFRATAYTISNIDGGELTAAFNPLASWPVAIVLGLLGSLFITWGPP